MMRPDPRPVRNISTADRLAVVLWLLIVVAWLAYAGYRLANQHPHTRQACEAQGGRWYQTGVDRRGRPTFTCLDLETGETL